jgi:hypothetical protein
VDDERYKPGLNARRLIGKSFAYRSDNYSLSVRRFEERGRVEYEVSSREFPGVPGARGPTILAGALRVVTAINDYLSWNPDQALEARETSDER